MVERDRIAKGYEYSRGQYVTVEDEELKALQIESSKIIDLTQFGSRDEVDPVLLDTPYNVYPDGELAAKAFQVISDAMAAKGLVGIGRVTISSRERLVLVEPHGGGLLMFTLRSSDEVRAAEFAAKAKSEADADMVAVAETIIERRRAKFDPATFRDRYQDALRDRVESKLEGVAQAPRPVAEPSKVINLMDALKRSLAQEATAEAKPEPQPRRAKAVPDRLSRPCCCRYQVGAGKRRSRRLPSPAPSLRREGGRRRDRHFQPRAVDKSSKTQREFRQPIVNRLKDLNIYRLICIPRSLWITLRITSSEYNRIPATEGPANDRLIFRHSVNSLKPLDIAA